MVVMAAYDGTPSRLIHGMRAKALSAVSYHPPVRLTRARLATLGAFRALVRTALNARGSWWRRRRREVAWEGTHDTENPPAGDSVLDPALRAARFPVLINVGEFCRGPRDAGTLSPSGVAPRRRRRATTPGQRVDGGLGTVHIGRAVGSSEQPSTIDSMEQKRHF
jgi:hypothetical protein